MKKVLLGSFLCLALLAFLSCSPRSGRSMSDSTAGASVSKADAPIISPQTGSFPAGTLITISSATQDAVIKYTTDGTTPSSTNGIIYAQPIELSTSTIKAVAIKEQLDDSELTTGSYSVQAPYSPEFSQPGATYNNPVVVDLSAQGDYDQIKYTTDGSDPHNGTVYTAPITISATGTTIKAITINASVASSESSATYVLKAATPTLTHNTCPTIQILCPTLPIINSSSIKMSLFDDLYAAVPVVIPITPVPLPINCTKCVFISGNTTGSAFEWRYAYTVSGSTTPVYSSWNQYCQKIACTSVSLPVGVTNFSIEAKATKSGMVDSDVRSNGFYK